MDLQTTIFVEKLFSLQGSVVYLSANWVESDTVLFPQPNPKFDQKHVADSPTFKIFLLREFPAKQQIRAMPPNAVSVENIQFVLEFQ